MHARSHTQAQVVYKYVAQIRYVQKTLGRESTKEDREKPKREQNNNSNKNKIQT